MREYRLNCLNYALGDCPKLYRCFKDGANRKIVLEFLTNCHGSGKGDLWTRITRVCDALQNALRSINVLSGETSETMDGSGRQRRRAMSEKGKVPPSVGCCAGATKRIIVLQMVNGLPAFARFGYHRDTTDLESAKFA